MMLETKQCNNTHKSSSPAETSSVEAYPTIKADNNLNEMYKVEYLVQHESATISLHPVLGHDVQTPKPLNAQTSFRF